MKKMYHESDDRQKKDGLVELQWKHKLRGKLLKQHKVLTLNHKSHDEGNKHVKGIVHL